VGLGQLCISKLAETLRPQSPAAFRIRSHNFEAAAVESQLSSRSSTVWLGKHSVLTYLIASSNTLFKFRWVRAEHSKYLCARISFATIKAWSYVTGSMRFCLKLSSVAGSSLKSSFVPTRMMGTEGAWWSISGNHYGSEVSTGPMARSRYLPTFARTLSNDGGETMEKQMRKTSVCGYERGRSRS